MVRKLPDMEEAHVNKEVNNAHVTHAQQKVPSILALFWRPENHSYREVFRKGEKYTLAEMSRIKADQR